jgi:hypothetical protein
VFITHATLTPHRSYKRSTSTVETHRHPTLPHPSHRVANLIWNTTPTTLTSNLISEPGGSNLISGRLTTTVDRSRSRDQTQSSTPGILHPYSQTNRDYYPCSCNRTPTANTPTSRATKHQLPSVSLPLSSQPRLQTWILETNSPGSRGADFIEQQETVMTAAKPLPDRC